MTVFQSPERVPLPFNVRLTTEQLSAVSALAEHHGTTKSAVIRGLLQSGLVQLKASART